MSRLRRRFSLKLGDNRLYLGERTNVMAIINRTPDSFSDGGIMMNDTYAMNSARRFVKKGADILDVGGESTRPGANRVSAKEEIRRTVPFVKKLAKSLDVPISIDTTKSEVAEAALDAGAVMVNDISGLRRDKKIAKVIARHKAGCVIMHSKGTPKTMQKNPAYKNLMREVMDSLKKSIEAALSAGVDKNKIIIDPGIGFGKTLEHNLRILKSLKELEVLNMPIMIGTSRKSFIGNVLDRPLSDRVFGTAASVAWAAANGAHIVRVHDVDEMKQVASLIDAIINA
ncbi:MAG: dihydropteroate synthase [Candidatus Omnitrophota bacterium]